MDNTTQNKEKEKDALAAFAGISIFLAVLAIVFGTSGARNRSDTANQVNSVPSAEPPSIVLEVSAEATELFVELTAETPETTLEEATAEITEIVVIVEETPETTVETSSYSPELVAQGEALFVTCTACHGVDGRGIPGLGKDLVAGEFALTTSDTELVNFIITGRPIWDAANTTGIDMPPRGGNPALTDDDVFAIVAYLRTLQASSTETSAAPEETAAGETAASTSSYTPEQVAQGQALFVTCTACHGVDGRGIPGLGKDLVAGEFALTTSDPDLFTFIITGRPIWDAANTTGIDMPPRGGNPALTDDDVWAIIAYIRSLQNQ